MSDGFAVLVSPHFERLAKRLVKTHSDFPQHLQKAIVILTNDPYNQTRQHWIRKLVGEQPANGQWRLRSGRFRFRYDIVEQTVELKYCGLRREDTY